MAQTLKLKRSSTQHKVPSTSDVALGELAINTYDGRIFFKKNDGSDSIEHIVTTDSISTGSIQLTSGVTAATLTLSGLSAQNSEATSLMINGSNVVGTRELGSNAFTSTTIGTNTNSLTVDDTTIQLNSGTTFNGSAARTISGKTAAVSNGGTALATGDQIYDFVIGLGYSTTTGTVDTSGTPADNDYAKFTDANTVEGRSYTEVKTDLSLNNVENTAVSTWAGTSNITTLGTIGTGTWNGTAIASAYLDSDTAHLTGTQTFTGAKTFQNTVSITGDGSNAATLTETGGGLLTIATVDDIVLDAGGDITIDAGGNDIRLFSSGTEFGKFKSDSSNLSLYSSIQDKDILFKGNDDGSTITALTLDMSNGGSATFRDDIDFGGKITQTGTGNNTFAGRVDVNDSTQSTSKTTGALVVDGGVGIVKTLSVGEDVVAYASSDERYKDNIIPIQNPNEKIKQIGGYTFDWNDKHEIFKGQHDIGVVAQEIEKVLPEIVETRDNGYKAVKYEKIVALLIESNKELIKRVEDLESTLSVEKGRD